MSLYWEVRGKLEDARKKLSSYKKEDLIHLLINERYNQFVSDHADYADGENPVDETIENGKDHGKRVPYVGWYWRHTDFSRRKISIGNCGEFIGIMENNKWGYPERFLTEEEANKVIEIIELAKDKSEEGGSLGEIVKNTNRELEKLWPYFQTLKI